MIRLWHWKNRLKGLNFRLRAVIRVTRESCEYSALLQHQQSSQPQSEGSSMKATLLTIFVSCLLLAPSYAESDLEERVTRLEEQVRQLYEQLGSRPRAQQPYVSPETRSSSDPLIGRWFCSDGSFSTEIFFEASGRMLQKEPVLGKTGTSRWYRMSKNKISTAGGASFNIEFESENQLSVQEPNTRTSWDCDRILE